MSKHEKVLNELEEYLKEVIDPDFDFDVEHWDNGNFDDSYTYGSDCGEQYAYREILGKLVILKQDNGLDE